MLDKDTFIKYMNEIIKQHDAIEELYECLDKSFGATGEGLISNIMSVSLPIKILTDVMNDTNGWIEYFIYECDCGRDGENMIWEGEDKPVPFYTVEDLWNVLTSNVDFYSIT